MSEPRVRVEDAIPDKYMSERRARATGATRRGETWRYDWDPVGTRQRGRMAMPMEQVLEEIRTAAAGEQTEQVQTRAERREAAGGHGPQRVGGQAQTAQEVGGQAGAATRAETVDRNQELGDALLSWAGRTGFVVVAAAVLIWLAWGLGGDSVGLAALFVFVGLALLLIAG